MRRNILVLPTLAYVLPTQEARALVASCADYRTTPLDTRTFLKKSVARLLDR